MSKWGSEIKLLAWSFFRPRNLLFTVRAFAYLLTVRALLDFQLYWRTWDSAPYVEVGATYLRDTALMALIVGAIGTYDRRRKTREAD